MRKIDLKWAKLTQWSMMLLIAMGIVGCKTTDKLKEDSTVQATAKTDDAKSEELADALLWKIEGNGLTQHSYLYGTIHMIEEESFFWPQGSLAAFEDSEKVAFEIDMNDMFDMGAQMGLLTKAFMKDGKTLKDLYSEEDYTFVKDHFSDMGIPMFFLEKLKPMFLTVFASGDVEFGKGFGEDSGIKSYEMELFEMAKETKKEVSGLETMEYQMAVFDSIPYEAQATMLLETIKGGDEEDDTFQQMIDLYTSQNISGMVSFMSEAEEGGIEGYEDVLLYTRNKNWIPVMAEKMTAAKTFFAVGAGHLGGKDGVIDLLKKEGYKLTPLSHKKGEARM